MDNGGPYHPYVTSDQMAKDFSTTATVYRKAVNTIAASIISRHPCWIFFSVNRIPQFSLHSADGQRSPAARLRPSPMHFPTQCKVYGVWKTYCYGENGWITLLGTLLTRRAFMIRSIYALKTWFATYLNCESRGGAR